MKLFGWFNSSGQERDRLQKPATEIPDTDHVRPLVKPDFRRLYDDKACAASDDASDLNRQIRELEIKLFNSSKEVDQLRTDLLNARLESARSRPKQTPESEQANFSQIFTQLSQLARAGDRSAQFYVGISHLIGLGNKKDSFLGEQWLTKSANAGEAHAQFVLGVFKWHGVFLERGVQQSFQWLQLAKKNGHEEIDKVIGEVRAAVAKLRSAKREATKSEGVAPPEVSEPPVSPPLRKHTRKWPDQEFNGLVVHHVRGTAFRPEEEYERIHHRAYSLGHRLGKLCRKRAVRLDRLMSAHNENFERRDLVSLGRRFAMRRGYLQHSLSEGMEELKLSEDEITGELREAFIKGVKAGLVQ